MILSYWPRLLSLCFASFFLVHAAATCAIWALQSRAIRFAERISAGTAERFLFAIRLLPFAAASIAALGFCAPSYLRFEESMLAEKVGPACLALAALGLIICVLAFERGLRAAAASLQFAQACRSRAQVVRLRGTPPEMLVIPGLRPFLAQCGIFRPRIVISHELLRAFSAEELEAALNHERAHWQTRDNLKRLLLAFLPDALPLLPTLQILDAGWAKFAERAADDSVRGIGDRSAVHLASALVRLARTGNLANTDACPARATSALGGTGDLAGRVHRLLALPATCPPPETTRVSMALGTGSLLAVGCLASLFWAATLSPVHELLERLLH
jgi:Zn-dependent protease with chaperone function